MDAVADEGMRMGSMAFGCSLCATRRGAVKDGWAYRPRWRVCEQHGRWLLDAGQGHSLQCVDVAGLAVNLGRTQRRWEWVARAGQVAFGADQGEVFAPAACTSATNSTATTGGSAALSNQRS